jgi:molecular chaperone GrpE
LRFRLFPKKKASGNLELVENENLQQSSEPEVSSEETAPESGNVRLAALTAERDQLAAEKADLYDRLLRRQAEFENFRRRAERERSDYLQFASMELVGNLLPVLDDFERALKVESTDREYVKGIELIYQRFYDSLKKTGLEPIEAAGKPFDPNFHQAVERVHTDEVEDQTVLAEFQRGYNFKGKLLRPAMVKVAVKP